MMSSYDGGVVDEQPVDQGGLEKEIDNTETPQTSFVEQLNRSFYEDPESPGYMPWEH